VKLAAVASDASVCWACGRRSWLLRMLQLQPAGARRLDRWCAYCEVGWADPPDDDDEDPAAWWRPLGEQPARPRHEGAMMSVTTDPDDPRLGHGPDTSPTPQNEAYLVLSEEERAKGFTRPVRRAYRHRLCGSVTTMDQTIAETYARQPGFYHSTYCVRCAMHRPVAEFTWTDPDGCDTGQQVGS